MPATNVRGYRVTGATAVIRKDGNERYVARGGVFLATALDKANAKHLVRVGLIEPIDLPAPEPDEPDESGSSESASTEDAGAGTPPAAPPKRAARRSRKTVTPKEPAPTDPDADAGSSDAGDGNENA